jgi:hypothetical protein
LSTFTVTISSAGKPFSVTVGTVMERSKVPLCKWVLAAQLMASSKKGVSAHQLHRTRGITYRSAWFMAHRIREAMRAGGLAPMGGNGGIVEADEMDHAFCLDIQRQYLGRVEGHYTDWTPLVSRYAQLPGDTDPSDPWQFRNVLAG